MQVDFNTKFTEDGLIEAITYRKVTYTYATKNQNFRSRANLKSVKRNLNRHPEAR